MIRLPENAVPDCHFITVKKDDPLFDDRFVAVTDRRLVGAGGIHHSDPQPHFFHLRIREPDPLHEIGSGFLEPAEIIRIMNNAHLVSFVILRLMRIRIITALHA